MWCLMWTFSRISGKTSRRRSVQNQKVLKPAVIKDLDSKRLRSLSETLYFFYLEKNEISKLGFPEAWVA